MSKTTGGGLSWRARGLSKSVRSRDIIGVSPL